MIQPGGLPGDIVLYPAYGASALSSRMVAAGEILAGMGRGLVQYSHAAILAETAGHQYEATFPKTGRFPVDTKRIHEVWRVGSPTQQQREWILAWCRKNVGRWYNLVGVLTGGLVQLPNTYYCSQFAGLAYRSAGIGIGDDIMSPDSIPDTPGARMLRRVDPRRA